MATTPESSAMMIATLETLFVMPATQQCLWAWEADFQCEGPIAYLCSLSVLVSSGPPSVSCTARDPGCHLVCLGRTHTHTPDILEVVESPPDPPKVIASAPEAPEGAIEAVHSRPRSSLNSMHAMSKPWKLSLNALPVLLWPQRLSLNFQQCHNHGRRLCTFCLVCYSHRHYKSLCALFDYSLCSVIVGFCSAIVDLKLRLRHHDGLRLHPGGLLLHYGDLRSGLLCCGNLWSSLGPVCSAIVAISTVLLPSCSASSTLASFSALDFSFAASTLVFVHSAYTWSTSVSRPFSNSQVWSFIPSPIRLCSTSLLDLNLHLNSHFILSLLTYQMQIIMCFSILKAKTSLYIIL